MPFESVYFYDDLSVGDSEVNYDIRSGDQPKMLFVVNEANSKNNELFYRQIDRSQRDDIAYYLLGDLQGSGRQSGSFYGEMNNVYMKFTNYDEKGAHLDLRISSKIFLNCF